MAGDALVVWEAETGPVAPDSIAALGEGGKQDRSWGGDWPHPLFAHPHRPRAGWETLLPLEGLTLEKISKSLAPQKTPALEPSWVTLAQPRNPQLLCCSLAWH